MLVGADSRKPWDKMDRVIMLAYQTLQEERCPRCGSPIWLCDNDDQSLDVRIRRRTCYASDEIEAYRERYKDDGDLGGLQHEFYSRNGTPLQMYRELYTKQVAERRLEESGDEEDDD